MKNPGNAVFPGALKIGSSLLSLRELRSAAGGLEAVLLALLHSGVAGQEPGFLEGGAVGGIHLQQGAGDAVTDGAGLAGDAAAGDGGLDVHLALHAGGDQGLTDDELQGLKAEIIVDVAAIDGDGAGAVGEKTDAGDRALAAAGPVKIRLLAGIHVLFSSLRPDFGLLGRVLVLAAGIDLQALQLGSAQLVLAQHALHGQLEGELRALGHQVAVLGLMETAGIAGVGAVVLLVQLLAGEQGLVRVDDDDEITAIHVGGVGGLQLAAEQVGGDDGGAAHGLSRGVQHVPLALHSGLVCHGSGHFLNLQRSGAD